MAGGPGWRHIKGAKSQPGSIEAALGAISAGCPDLHIKGAHCELVPLPFLSKAGAGALGWP